MKRIRNNMKVIIAFVIGLIISGASTYALTVASKDVTYNNTNVESAINDLYSKVGSSGGYEYVTTTTINYASTTPVTISLEDYAGCSRLTADDIFIPSSANYYDAGSVQWSKKYGITNRSYNSSTCTLTLTMGVLENPQNRSTYIIYTFDIPVFVKVK